MAYWLFCQSCQQWSKSATPLSEEKACPFCSALLMKVRGSTNSMAGGGGAKESAASILPVIVEVPLENAATREAVSPEVNQEQEINEPVEVNEVVDQSPDKEPELTSEDMEEPESDTGSRAGRDEPTVDLRSAMAEEEDVCEDEDEEESGEAKSPEADSVKISEVRVITDQSEKKDRLAKKTRR